MCKRFQGVSAQSENSGGISQRRLAIAWQRNHRNVVPQPKLKMLIHDGVVGITKIGQHANCHDELACILERCLNVLSNHRLDVVKTPSHGDQLTSTLGLDLFDISQELPQFGGRRRDLLRLTRRLNFGMLLTQGRQVDHVAGKRRVAGLPTGSFANGALNAVEKVQSATPRQGT